MRKGFGKGGTILTTLKFFSWLRQPRNTIWWQPAKGALFVILYVIAVLVSTRYLPTNLFPDIPSRTVDGLLTILASSMLAVTTFSLSIMVGAFSSAARGATPRSVELVMADDSTRLAIASFISTFIYAIITKIALGSGFFAQNGRFLFFLSTIVVIAYLIVVLIRWVQVLSTLGHLGDTMGKVYAKAAETMRRYRSLPNLGATWVPAKDALPDVHFICAETGEFAQIHLDLLQEWAKKYDAHVFIRLNPGDFLYRGEPLADIYLNDGSSSLTEEDLSLLRSFFIVKPTRSYEQDPRFGFIVLKEIAQRSISPSMNDPGSVIAAMNLMAKLLLDATAPRDNMTVYDRIGMQPLQETDFIYRSFDGIIRDSDQNAGISIQALHIMYAVSRHAPEETIRKAARIQARLILEHARRTFSARQDLFRVESAYVRYFPDDTPIEASAYFPDDEAAERQKSLADADLTTLFEEPRDENDRQ